MSLDETEGITRFHGAANYTLVTSDSVMRVALYALFLAAPALADRSLPGSDPKGWAVRCGAAIERISA